MEYLAFARQLATTAGQALVQAYQHQSNQLGVRQSPKGLKLAEDRTIDQFIVERIQAEYPNHDIVTEERPAIRHGSRYCWLIDPIDGSVNFATRNPFVAVSIALLVDNQLELGVIEAPLLSEQFVAVRGQGATMNGQPLRVSTTASLNDAYLVSCDGGTTDRTQVFSTLIRNYYDQVKDLRKLGSAALECAWVATGRADAYLTMAIDPWDVAAGILLIQEAGGMVTNFKGEAWQGESADLVCSNTLLHPALMERLW